MLVDDKWDLLAMTTKMLEKSGYVVHAFSSSQKALEHVKEEGCNECSIVISDIRMPGMSGFELVRQIKEARPEMKTVLVTSFEIHKEEAQKVLPSVKVDDFITKPFTAAKVIEVLMRTLTTIT